MTRLFEERHFPLRYPLVGVATFVLESALYSTLLMLLDKDFYLTSYYVAGVAALLFNFTGHKFFTFKNQKVRHPLKQLMMEAGLKLSILATRGWLLTLLVEQLTMPRISGVGVTALGTAVTFTATSWIFGGSYPKQTWKLIWGYGCLGWWLAKEFVRSLKTRLCA